jgi:hypothetical protein
MAVCIPLVTSRRYVTAIAGEALVPVLLNCPALWGWRQNATLLLSLQLSLSRFFVLRSVTMVTSHGQGWRTEWVGKRKKEDGGGQNRSIGYHSHGTHAHFA